ncbi:MAG: ArsR/SmtB family transcription factor [Planctomycetota bacterium]
MEPPLANTIFRAFADETRLRILHLVRTEEMCVGDIVAVLELPQPTVSRHLSHLRQAGLVTARKHGLWRYYRLAAPTTPLQEHLLDCLGTCFVDVPVIAEDATRALAVKAEGGCCP